ncbi:MAG: hypothetical protein K2Y71_29255 [Xanthobacteraceae bacterium]|nr:hypothetical protein [Xanthobacteraceae bacterium]
MEIDVSAFGHPDNPRILSDAILEVYNLQSANRVWALMGPSGAGKSNLLLEAAKIIQAQKVPCFHLPSDRRLNSLVPFGGFSAPAFKDLDDLWSQIVSALSASHPDGSRAIPKTDLSAVLGFLFLQLVVADRSEESRYISELYAHEKGRVEVKPTKKPSLVKAAEAKLQTILDCRITIRDQVGPDSAPDVRVTRGEQTFDVTALSDGEKQMMLLGLFLMGPPSAQRCVFLVDEPELYLNEAGAVQFWERLEQAFPSAMFVYATHSLVFATRPGVTNALLVAQGRKIEAINVLDSPDAMRQVVGARIQLLRSEKSPVFCEDGLAKLIIGDLFRGRQDIELIALGSWKTVAAAAKGEAGWAYFRSAGPRFCGIIDRDTRDQNEIAELEARGLFCFPLFETESFLLVPEIATWMLTVAAGTSVSSDEYLDCLVECARSQVGPTLDRVRSHLCHQAMPRLDFAASSKKVDQIAVTAPTSLKKDFEKRAAGLYAALDARDAGAILRLFKGKRLYQALRGRTRTQFNVALPEKPQQQYNQVREHPAFSAIVAGLPWLRDFTERVSRHLSA